MKNFIKKLSFFILPIIPFAFLSDYIISDNLKQTSKSQGEFEVWNDIYDRKIEADIAIYGSSRAWVHFNPEIFENILHKKTYNFGVNGHNFWLQYFRHKEFFKFNHHPKTIIISVDVFSLTKRDELFNYAQFLPYMLWNNDIYNYTHSYDGFSKIEYFIPLIRYSGEINLLDIFSKKTDLRFRHKGFRGMEKEWNFDLKKAKETKSNHSIKIDTNTVVLFNTFIKDIKKEGINLIFVYTPEYIEGQSFVSNRKQIISIFSNLSAKYEIPFFNYSDSLISHNKKLFYNTTHLNKKGADIFTNKFIGDLIKYDRTIKNIINN